MRKEITLQILAAHCFTQVTPKHDHVHQINLSVDIAVWKLMWKLMWWFRQHLNTLSPLPLIEISGGLGDLD